MLRARCRDCGEPIEFGVGRCAACGAAHPYRAACGCSAGVLCLVVCAVILGPSVVQTYRAARGTTHMVDRNAVVRRLEDETENRAPAPPVPVPSPSAAAAPRQLYKIDLVSATMHLQPAHQKAARRLRLDTMLLQEGRELTVTDDWRRRLKVANWRVRIRNNSGHVVFAVAYAATYLDAAGREVARETRLARETGLAGAPYRLLPRATIATQIAKDAEGTLVINDLVTVDAAKRIKTGKIEVWGEEP